MNEIEQEIYNKAFKEMKIIGKGSPMDKILKSAIHEALSFDRTFPKSSSSTSFEEWFKQNKDKYGLETKSEIEQAKEIFLAGQANATTLETRINYKGISKEEHEQLEAQATHQERTLLIKAFTEKLNILIERWKSDLDNQFISELQDILIKKECLDKTFSKGFVEKE